MSRPSRYGKQGRSFDSETSVFTTPPLSPRASHLVGSQLVSYHGGGGASHGSSGGHSDRVRPTYYVQSPSRDSFTFNEGDSLSQSFAAKSTPPLSPTNSPLPKTFASKPHQHQHQHQHQHHNHNQQQAFYANARPFGSRRVIPQPSSNAANVGVGGAPTGGGVTASSHKKGYQPWNGGGTIQEEEESRPLGSTGRRGISKWCALFLSIVFAILCIVVVGFIYWLVVRPSPPKVEVKSINFQTFAIDQGNDPSGVPTQVLTANVTTALTFSNPSKYFGFHVSAPDVTMSYQEIVVASGESRKFFQKKRSTGTISVEVYATRTPVYGAGPNLLSTFSSGDGLPLQLHIGVQSEAYVIWKIVRPKYRSNIACDLVLDTSSTQVMLKILSQDCHRG